ncbi:AsmA family protein [Magnetococcus marinus MC-1]|uniref:AsmA family protein n=1 Tax=Magnetococcus marinus (strain ATCC BAA-1437 / JCM 17883 / MC-1) TaxID=156889 RepID=A0L3Z3_MAGMM|nr:AsmA family protein [Magnetococcus marinus]ABK42686.1 AsmA family protein [Magnetococcus marinus MC-1]
MKKLLIALISLIVLVIVVLVAIPLFVDPNEHKPLIAEKVHEATGRTLSLNGNLHLSLFPWAGVTIEAAELGNPADIGVGQAMVKLNKVDVRVKLMPLLSKQVVVDRIIIDGLEAHLIRDKHGKDNWSDLSGGGKGAQTDTAAPQAGGTNQEKAAGSSPLAGLSLGGVEISNAKVSFRDEQADLVASLNPLNLATGAVALGQPVDLTLDAKLAKRSISGKGEALDVGVQFSGQLQPAADMQSLLLNGMKLMIETTAKGLPVTKVQTQLSADVAVDLKGGTVKISRNKLAIEAEGSPELGMDTVRAALTGSIGVNLEPLTIEISGLDLTVQGNGGKLPGGSVDLHMAADLLANMAAGTVGVKNLRLEGFEQQLKASGDVDVSNLNGDPRVGWQLTMQPTSPKGLMSKLGLPALQTADPTALTKLALAIQGKLEMAGAGSVALSKFDLTLDDTHLTGTVSAPRLDGTAARFDLRGDGLNLDRYMMTAGGEGAKAAQPNSTAEGKAAATGDEILIDQATMAQLRKLDIKGQIVLDRLTAAKGHFEKVTIKVDAGDGVLKLNPFSVNLYKGSLVTTGQMDVRGNEPKMAFRKVLQGVQVGDMLKEMADVTLITGQADLDLDTTTQGSTMKGLKRHVNGRIQGGVTKGTLQGLDILGQIKAAYAMARGKPAPSGGSKDTAFDDMLLDARIVDGVIQHERLKVSSNDLIMEGKGTVDLAEEQLDYHMEAKVRNLGGDGKSLTVPVLVKGSWNSPGVSVDTAALLQSLAKEQAQDKINDVLDKKLGDKAAPVKQLLKGLKLF